MKTETTQNQNKKNEKLYNGQILLENHLYAEAVNCLKKAYEEGCLEAACKLGQIYMDHHYQNYEKAFYWLQIAAEGGIPEAQFLISGFYEFDLLDKYDLAIAYQWLSKAAEQGEPQALLRLSFWYRMGIYIQQDLQHSLNILTQLADSGNAEALCQLGKEYECGSRIVEKDSQKTWTYYQKAAQKHHPYALYKLGKYYWSKRMFQYNVQKAVNYLKESSVLGCCEAQYLLANICGTYFYYHVNDRYHWLLAAAKNRQPEAMYDLGCLFLFGNSFLKPDREKARYWLQKAKEYGIQKKNGATSLLVSDFGTGRFRR